MTQSALADFESSREIYGRTILAWMPTLEIRRSIDGYASGASIHCKAGMNRHTRQLQYMKPMLRRWVCDGGEIRSTSSPGTGDYVPKEAGRKRAA
ncbi:hypothetical protein GGR50DRAFT_208793 [Xylaria sp. CBS 124048]|nr:hypothetical protein GGR50DRAFT_208793 [Xylaria sp. CBS 124048]